MQYYTDDQCNATMTYATGYLAEWCFSGSGYSYTLTIADSECCIMCSRTTVSHLFLRSELQPALHVLQRLELHQQGGQLPHGHVHPVHGQPARHLHELVQGVLLLLGRLPRRADEQHPADVSFFIEPLSLW